MEDKEVRVVNRMKEMLQDGKLPCAAAHLITKETGVSLERIGELANEQKIKISKCQLGCF